MKSLIVAILALTIFAVIGTGTASAANEARIRVLHASPDAPAVDVYVNGTEVITNLSYPEITDYVPLAPGSYDIAVYPASANGSGTPVIAASVTLSANTDYTVAAVGNVAQIEPLVLVDDNTLPAPGQAHLRFVHASPDAPAVDIAAAGAGVVVSNAAFKDASGYLPLPSGSYDLSVLAAGTSTVALDLPGVQLEAGKVYTAFAIGLLDGDPALTAKLVVDAAASPAAPSTGTGLAPVDNSTPSSTFVLIGLGLMGLAAVAGVATSAMNRIRREA